MYSGGGGGSGSGGGGGGDVGRRDSRFCMFIFATFVPLLDTRRIKLSFLPLSTKNREIQ